MEEKIQLQHPKPFSSGFHIPFIKQNKPPHFSFQASSLEYLKEIRRLALYFPEAERTQITALESWAVQQMIKKNRVWFKNDLSPTEIEARFRPSIQPDGHLLVRANPAQLPKHLSLNDRPVENWSALMASGLEGLNFASVSLVCHGIYLHKKYYELIWKLEGLHIYTLTDQEISLQTNIDEYKEEIESQWAAEIDALENSLNAETAKMEAILQKRRGELDHFKSLLNQSRHYRTNHPEWHKTLEYLQAELYRAKKNYFI
jgi:hypothetical protein